MECWFGAELPRFTSCAEHLCLLGYGGGDTTIEEIMKLVLKVHELDGVASTRFLRKFF